MAPKVNHLYILHSLLTRGRFFFRQKVWKYNGLSLQDETLIKQIDKSVKSKCPKHRRKCNDDMLWSFLDVSGFAVCRWLRSGSSG